MSSDESDEGSIIDCDAPRPPYLLVQDAYQVSRDFYCFLRKGIEDGTYRQWPTSLISQVGSVQDYPLLQCILSVATREGGADNCDGGLLSKCRFDEHLSTLRDSASSIASRCSERCAAVKNKITGNLPSRSTETVSSPPKLPTITESPSREVLSPQQKLAEVIMDSTSKTSIAPPARKSSDTSAARRQSIIETERKASLVRREIRDFIAELTHSRVPDYPQAFYAEGTGGGASSGGITFSAPAQHHAPEPPRSHKKPATEDAPVHQTIVVQPKTKPSQDRVVFGRVMSPKPAEIPREDEPQPAPPVHAKVRNIPVRLPEAASVQKDFSQSQSYGERFRQPSPQAQPAPAVPIPVIPSEPHGYEPPRASAGEARKSPSIEDSLSRFQQEVRRLEQVVPQAPAPVHFTTVPAPFSQAENEYEFPSLGVSGQRFEGKISPVSPKHDPAHSAFTPPLRSSPVVRKDHPNYPRMATDYADAAAKPENVIHVPKVSTKFLERWKADEPPVQDPHNIDQRAAYARHGDIPVQGVAKIRGQWPPPSNAVGADFEKEMFPPKAHDSVAVQKMDAHFGQKYSRRHDEYVEEPEAAIEEPRHEPPPPPAPRPREPSPQRGRPTYQSFGAPGSKTRAFSPVLFSAPRPFSPTYDYTPKLNFNMSRSFDPHHVGHFDSTQSFVSSGPERH